MTHETTAARASLADLGEGTADAPASTSLSGAARAGVAAAAPAPFSPRLCLHCKQPITKRGHKESNPQWKRRRFCARPCVDAYRRANPETFGVPHEFRTVPEIKKEWPAHERFDAPGMNMPEGPGNFVRFNPNAGRWI